MSSPLSDNFDKFDQLSLRERALVGITVLVVIIGGWLYFYADPQQSRTSAVVTENKRISTEITATRTALSAIRSRIQTGVHREDELKLAKLNETLESLEKRLRLKTVELIEPAQMFDLISQLLHQDSRLQLKALRREEVRPAIPVPEGQEQKIQEPQIYRHVMAVEFSGSYLDMLTYIEQLESLDWKLIWDEIEILSKEYPVITVRLVMSTLSTNKEWVGV